MKKQKIFYIGILILIILFFIFLLFETYNEIDNQTSLDNTYVSSDDEWVSVSDVDISDVPEDVIGYLSIPCLNNDYYMDMPIKDTTDLSVLATAIGHFESTPYLNGNVCLAAHNSGTNKNGEYVGYFDSIKNLVCGDYIIYNDLSNTYTYSVISNTIISETDLSVLENTEENMLTLITCVNGSSNRAYRQCIVAIRID